MRVKAKPRRVTVIRYLDRGTGLPVLKGTPGSYRLKMLSDTYFGKVNGKRVSLETTDEAEAWTRLHRLRSHAKMGRAAVLQEGYEGHAKLPLQAHVDAWIAMLTDKGTSAGVRKLARARVLKLARLAGWKYLPDLTATTCLRGLALLRDKEGLSAQTRNHYLTQAKQFARWAYEDKRIEDNPLIGLRPVSVETDRRHDRRAPTDEEVAALFEWLAKPQADAKTRRVRSADRSYPLRYRYRAASRAMLYKVAMATGFRAAEMISLSRDSFDLENGLVTVEAAYSKHRRKDTAPLPAWLVGELQAWFKAGKGCWGKLPRTGPGKLLEYDLAGAGIARQIDGRFFDFHSLRHFFVTAMANTPSISPRALMALCRHSTPSLTMKVYSRARLSDQRAAVDGLPPIGRAPEKPPEKPEATGEGSAPAAG